MEHLIRIEPHVTRGGSQGLKIRVDGTVVTRGRAISPKALADAVAFYARSFERSGDTVRVEDARLGHYYGKVGS